MAKSYNVNLIRNHVLEISGDGSNKLWENAYVLSDFISHWEEGFNSKTEFRALWNDTHFYFLYKVFDSKIHIDKTNDSIESINESDRVEFFFRVDESMTPYYCLEIDPTPRIMNFKALPNKIFDFNWMWPKDNILIKSNITKGGYSVEGAIKIKSLKELNLLKNGEIQVGLYRAKYYKKENGIYEPTWISWVNPDTKNPNFHISSSFGKLILKT